MTSPAFATDEDLQARVQEVQDFFTVAELGVCVHYPASAKVYLSSCYDGVEMSPFCRKFPTQPEFTAQNMIRLRAMHRAQRALSRRLGIEEHSP